MSPVVSPRVCPGDLRLRFCPTLQLSCPGQGWELQTGGKTGCWGRWGGYFICSSGGSLPLNVSLGTDFSFFSPLFPVQVGSPGHYPLCPRCGTLLHCSASQRAAGDPE